MRGTCTTKSLNRFFEGREIRYKIINSFWVNVPFLRTLKTFGPLMLSGVIKENVDLKTSSKYQSFKLLKII